MQFDNQRDYNTNYPVTIYTSQEESKSDRIQPFFNLSISQDTDIPDVSHYSQIEFLMQHIEFKCDDILFSGLSKMFEQIMKIMDTNFTGISEIFIH